MIIASSEKVPLEKCPALVLNADFRPLSYYPLSLWCWQDAIKSVFLNRVSIVSSYERKVRSPSFEMSLPSVIALKSFVKPSTHPNFTRFNVFLRDKFACQYCGDKNDLTFAMRSMLDEMVRLSSHKVKLENITLESKMKLLLDSLKERDFISLPELILKDESKLAVSVILSAALELNRKGYIEIVQAEQFGEIYFKGSEEVVH